MRTQESDQSVCVCCWRPAGPSNQHWSSVVRETTRGGGVGGESAHSPLRSGNTQPRRLFLTEKFVPLAVHEMVDEGHDP